MPQAADNNATMTSALEYVQSTAFHTGYIPSFRYDKDRAVWIGNKRNFVLFVGLELSDSDFEAAQEGDYHAPFMREKVETTARDLVLALTASALDTLKPYGMDRESFETEIRFDSVTCEIWMKHKTLSGIVYLHDVYFSVDGEIQQYIAALK